MSAFLDYYRCSGQDDRMTTTGPLSASPGYFRFGNAVGYGRVAGMAPAALAGHALRDLHSSASTADGQVRLPFDLSAVVENLRRERYRRNGHGWFQRSTTSDAVRRLYYAI